MPYTIKTLQNDIGSSKLITGTLICFTGQEQLAGRENGLNDSVILVDPGLNMNLLNNNKDPKDLLYGKSLYDTLVTQWSDIIKNVSTIILTQSAVDKLGSYSFLFNHFQELIYQKDLKVYSTLPIVNLGRLGTIELYCNKNLMGHFIDHKYEVEDIEQSFDYIKPLKYSQPIKLLENNVQFIAYSSGHSLGSCVLKFINLKLENEFVLYFSEWSHVADSITDGTSILDRMNFWNPQNDVMHPSSIITNIDKSYTQEDSLQPWVKRSNKFKSFLFSNLNNNNLLLLPVDISSNFLKIFTLVAEFYQEYSRSDFEEDKLLDQFESFSSNINSNYYTGQNGKNKNKKQKREQLPPIYLLSNSKGRSLTYCKSMLEWLKDSLLKNWNNKFNKSGSNNNNLVKTPFDQEIQVLTPEDFNSDDRVSVLNKKKILETGGILFVNDDLFLLNQVIESFNSKDNNPSATKIHLMLTDIKQKQVYSDYSTGKDVDIILKRSEAVNDETILKQLNSDIVENSNKRKSLLADYDEKKKLAKQEAASLVYDVRDDEISESDDDHFTEEDEADEKEAFGNDGDLEKETENSPYDFVIKTTTSQKNKLFKIKTSTYMRDEYGLVVDFNELFAAGEDDTEDLSKSGISDNHNASESLSNENSSKNVQANLKNSLADNNDEDEDDMYNDFLSLSRNSVYDQSGSYFDDLSYLNVLNKKIFYKSKLIQKTITLRIATDFIDLSSIIDLKSSQIILPFFKAQNYIYFDQIVAKIGGIAENIKIINGMEEKSFQTVMKNLDCILSPDLEETLHWESVLNGKYQISKVTCDLMKVVNKESGNVKYTMKPGTETSNSGKITFSGERNLLRTEENGDLQLGNVTLSKIRSLLLQQNHEAVFLGNGSLL
ncbi:hypothetical protein QEN19_001896 [Hanseniaspora menglaensis]